MNRVYTIGVSSTSARVALSLLCCLAIVVTAFNTERIRPATAAPEVAQGQGGGRIFDITISLYNAPEGAQRDPYEANIRYFADGVYESTEGAHQIGRVTIYSNSERSDTADIVWRERGHPSANISGQSQDNKHIYMYDNFVDQIDFINGPNGPRLGGYTLAHEWGHYTYSLYDEYRNVGKALDPTDPGGPADSDTPVEPSMMNNQDRAVELSDYRWLNFSTGVNDTRNTAQHRIFQASGWDTIARPVSEDPPVGGRIAEPQRLYWPELTSAAPPLGELPRIDLGNYADADNPGNPARRQLEIIWASRFPTNNLSTQQVTNPTDGVVRLILVDVSAPMDAVPSRLANMVDALDQDVEAFEVGADTVGVIAFDSNTQIVQPLTLLDSEATIDTVINAIQNVAVGDASANIDNALATGLTTLQALYGGAGATITNGSVYLITGSSVAGELVDSATVTNYVNARVPIYSFGYGVDEASANALQDISDKTRGLFRVIDAPPGSNDRTQFELVQALEAAYRASSPIVETNLVFGEGTLNGNETFEKTFQVDSSLDALEVVVTLATTDTLSLTLLNPSNAPVGTPECEDHGENEGSCTFLVTGPALVTGEWTLRIQAGAMPLDFYAYRVLGLATDNRIITADVEVVQGEIVDYPEPIVLSANLDRDRAIAGAFVEATIEAPDDSVEQLAMRDDGIDPDATANDGVYSAIADYTVGGDYSITVTFDNRNGTAEETYDGLALQRGVIDQPPDLMIDESFIRTAETQVYVAGVQADDHADASGTLTTLPSNNTGIAGKIDFADDIDSFQITSDFTGQMIFRADLLAVDMVPVLDLIDAGDNLLATVTFDPQSDSKYPSITYLVTAGETYTLEVLHASPTATTGFYEVSAGPPLGGESDNTVYLPMVVTTQNERLSAN